MRVKSIKPGDTVKSSEVFSPSGYGFKEIEWLKKPAHIPEPPKQTLYGIEAVDMNGNPAQFLAYPKPFKDALN
ncbi:hypothetical protein [Parasulfitobacter algicola]|uniref:Uncharacterized protein n=1 Tax=Parasulfitobacter algicola TaxID=2614809 RepID=A0ABX2J123_9RHOB|nr:hypothetical protein [Sulfitobacter algicola]NSX56893.1 hypothetical protein [Sulfitobacter algicola]